MSGHSKWHSIKHKKAATDAKRGKLFTKIIRELVVAARIGGADPDSNPRLRVAMASAKDVNMPKDTMERNIKKGAGDLEGVNFEDIAYEGYGPGGVAILVECSTDNKNRTAAAIRHCFNKNNGNLGSSGCVSYLFHKKGVIAISAEGVSEDDAMETALEAGAEDFSAEDGSFTITTAPNDLMAVRGAVEAKGLKIQSSSIQNIPETTVHVQGKDAESLLKLLSALEDDEDTANVSANFEMDDEAIAAFSR